MTNQQRETIIREELEDQRAAYAEGAQMPTVESLTREIRQNIRQDLYSVTVSCPAESERAGMAAEILRRWNAPLETALPQEPAAAMAVESEDYDLLPFEIYDYKSGRLIPVEGYEIDQRCCPHGTGGQRRKRGPLTHLHFWRKQSKTDSPKFFHGYRLTIGGKQKRVTDKTLSLARYNAERKRWGEEEF